MSDERIVVDKKQTTINIASPQRKVFVLSNEVVAEIQKHRPTLVTQKSGALQVQDRRPKIDVGGTGLQGRPGQDGDKTFRHQRAIPSDVWIVVHGLNKYPSVTVATSAGDLVMGSVRYDSLDQCTLMFSAAFSGQAFFN